MLNCAADAHISQIIMEGSFTSIAIFDEEMRYLSCNSRWIEDYGLHGSDILGCRHCDLFPHVSDRWLNIHKRVLAGQSLSSDSEPFAHADGIISWIEWRMRPWRSPTGHVGGSVLLTHKLNQQLFTEQREAMLDLMVDSATDYAVIMMNSNGGISFWSSGAERIYGWASAEVMGHSIALFLPPEIDAGRTLLKIFGRAIDYGVNRYRGELIKRDGTRFMVEASLSPIYDKYGNVNGFVSVTRDISREMDREKSLAEQSAQIHAILDTVPDAMVTIDESGIIVSFSATAEALFGYAAEEAIGCSVTMLFPASMGMQGFDRKYPVWRSGIAGAGERLIGRRKDGTTFHYELYVGEATANGRRIITGFIRDLTMRDKADEQLRKLQSDLSRTARIKSVQIMASALAHEINQPLTALGNYMQAAATLVGKDGEGALDDVRYALNAAGCEAIRAGEIVRRLREYISRGEIKIETLDVHKMLDQACRLGFASANSSNIVWEIEIDPDLGLLVADSIQIPQVLVNLIRNAIQALSNGGRILGRKLINGDREQS